METAIAAQFIEEINQKTDAVQLLQRIGYAADKIQVAGDSIKAFCPIHKDTRYRSLLVDAKKRTFKCTIKTCAGYGGGSLVHLFALARKTDPVSGAAEMAGALDLDIGTEWHGRLAQACLEEAESAFLHQQIDVAEPAARRALQFQPDCPEARLLLANIYIETGDTDHACEEFMAVAESYLARGAYEEADRALDSAARDFPDSEDVLFLQIRSAEIQNRPDIGERLLLEVADRRERAGRLLDNVGIYEKLVAIRPSDAQLRIRLGDLYEMQHDIKSACGEWEKAATLNMEAQQGAAAIPLLEKVLRFQPEVTHLRLALADELIRDGEYERAKQHIFSTIHGLMEQSDFVSAAQMARKWLEVEPASLEVHESLAHIYQEQGNSQEAASELRVAADIAICEGNVEKGLEFLFRVKFLQPDDITLRRDLVHHLTGAGQGAKAAFELLDIAEVHFGRNEPDQAEAALIEAAEADSSPPFRMQLASTLQTHGLRDRARQVYLKTAADCSESDDFATAFHCYDQLLQLDPSDKEALESRCRMLWRSGEREEGARAAAELASRCLDEGENAAACDLLQLVAGESTLDVATLQSLFELAVHTGDAVLAQRFYSNLEQWLPSATPENRLTMARQLLSLKADCEGALREVASVCLSAGQRGEAANAFVALADAEERRGDFARALEHVESAWQADSARSELLKRKASLLVALEDPDTARRVHREYLHSLRGTAPTEDLIKEYKYYLGNSPGDTDVRSDLADLLAQTGHADDAGEHYHMLLDEAEATADMETVIGIREKLLALDPASPQLQMDLARACYDAGATERAVELMVTASDAYAAAGSAADAADAVRRAHELAPDDAAILHKLAETERAAGKRQAFEKSLVKLVQLHKSRSNHADALTVATQLAALQPDNIDFRRQVAELHQALDSVPDAVTSWMEVARLLEDKGDNAGALEVLCEVSRLDPNHVPALEAQLKIARKTRKRDEIERLLLQLADIYLGQSACEDAEKTLNEIAKISPKNPAIAPAMARLAGMRGDATEAVRGYLAAALNYQSIGQPDKSVECLRMVLSLDAENMQAHEAIASHLEAGEQYAEAFPHRMALLRMSLAEGAQKQRKSAIAGLRNRWPSDAVRRLALAKLLVDGGCRQDAVVDLEKVAEVAGGGKDDQTLLAACELDAELTRTSATMRRAKAEALENTGQTESAVGWLGECVKLAVQEGRLAEAEEFGRKWMEMAPASPDALEQVATIYKLQQRTQRAVETYLALGALLRARGVESDAVRALRMALEIEVENVPVRQMLWQVLLEFGHEQEALVEMQQLADILIERRAYKDASTLLSRILEYRTNSVDTLQRLGSLVFEHEGFEKALPYFRKLLSLRKLSEPPDAVAHAYENILRLEGADVELRAEYAEFLENSGQHEQAKEQYLQTAQVFRDELNDVTRAIDFFCMATSVAPCAGDARIFEELATLHLSASRPEHAATSLREAVRLRESLSDYREALAALRRLVDLPGRQPQDFARMASFHERLGQLDEAAEAYRQAIRESQATSGTSRSERRSYVERLLELAPLDMECATQLIGLLPISEARDRALGLAAKFGEAGMEREEQSILEYAMAAIPNDIQLTTRMATFWRRRNDTEALRAVLLKLCHTSAEAGSMQVARSALEELCQMPTTPGASFELARLCVACGDNDRGAGAYCQAATELSQSAEYAKAAEALHAAMELDASSVSGPLVAAILREAKGMPDVKEVAQSVLEASLRSRSYSRAVAVGSALLEFSDMDTAQAVLRRVYERAGAAFVAAIGGGHAEWLLARKKRMDATAMVDFMTSLAGASPEVWSFAAQFYRKCGNKEAAATAFVKAGCLFEDAGAVTEEEACYRDALEEQPDDLKTLEALAAFYEREQRIEDAAGIVKRIAHIAVTAGEHPVAIDWLNRALKQAPHDTKTREELIDLLARTGKRDQAVEQLIELARQQGLDELSDKCIAPLERVLVLDADNETAILNLLKIASRQEDQRKIITYSHMLADRRARVGQMRQACQVLESVLKRYPEDIATLEKLAGFSQRAEDERNYCRALETLGRIYARDRDFPRAVTQFENLLKRRRKDRDLLRDLLDCCTEEGLVEKTIEYGHQLLEASRDASDWENVIHAARMVLKADPASPDRGALAEALFESGNPSEAVHEWMDAASHLRSKGDIEGAVSCLQRVVQVVPSSTQAWGELSALHQALGNTLEARNANFRLAQLLVETGQSQSANAVIARTVSIAPEDAESHSQALEIYRLSGEKDMLSQEIHWLSAHHLQNRDYAAAEALVREGLQTEPDNLALQELRIDVLEKLARTEEFMFRLGELANRFVDEGNAEKAAEQLERLKAIDPGMLRVREQLADIYLKAGNRSKANEELLFVISAKLGQEAIEEARDIADTLTRRDLQDLALHEQLARLFDEHGLSEAAGRYYMTCAGIASATGDADSQLKHLRAAIRVRPGWVEPLAKLAEACRTLQRPEEAVEALQQMAEALVSQKQTVEAIRVLRQLINLRPRDLQARHRLVDLYSRIGDTENQAVELRELMELLFMMGDNDTATSVYRQFAAVRPDDTNTTQRFLELFAQTGSELEILDEHLRLAETLARKGAFAEATAAFERVLAIAPSNVHTRERFIAFLQTRGMKARAVTEMMQLADALSTGGDHAGAMRWITEASVLDPDNTETVLGLAAASVRAGKLVEACSALSRIRPSNDPDLERKKLAAYRSIVESDSRNADALEAMADCLERIGRTKEAGETSRMLAEALSMNCEYPRAEEAYRKASQAAPQSLEELRDALVLHSHDPFMQFLDYVLYGDLLFERGDIDLALDAYHKARQISDERPSLIQKYIDALTQIAPETEALTDMLTLAQRYAETGDFQKAAETYSHVLLIDPANESAKLGKAAAENLEMPALPDQGGAAGAENVDALDAGSGEGGALIGRKRPPKPPPRKRRPSE